MKLFKDKIGNKINKISGIKEVNLENELNYKFNPSQNNTIKKDNKIFLKNNFMKDKNYYDQDKKIITYNLSIRDQTKCNINNDLGIIFLFSAFIKCK